MVEPGGHTRVCMNLGTAAENNVGSKPLPSVGVAGAAPLLGLCMGAWGIQTQVLMLALGFCF